MHGLADTLAIASGELPRVARRLREEGWRFVTATAVPEPEGWMLLYHFEQDEQLCHVRTHVRGGEPVPAIDDAYPAAFLVENEMRELQGVPVDGMSIDYDGNLYRDFSGTEGWVHVHGPGAGEVTTGFGPRREGRR